MLDRLRAEAHVGWRNQTEPDRGVEDTQVP
jgi:hypothetical protein